MLSLPTPIQHLIAALAKLPGIGPRSAERLALHIIQSDPTEVAYLAEILVEARKTIAPCRTCGCLTATQPCAICLDPARDAASLCVVERAVDALSIEKAGAFKGRYHVLGGKLSPVNGVGPEDLQIPSLERRLAAEPISELILALGTDVEGDATAYYLAKRFATPSVQVTRLAHGLPAGTGLEYADEVTLSRAIAGRTPIR